jgi:hypothetical protein
MKDHRPRSFPSRTQACFYVLSFFFGGLIRNTSLLILILFFGLAAAAAAVNTSKSFWHSPGFRSFIASFEAGIAGIGSSTADLDTQPQPRFKDPEKAQRDEIRARRNLVKELRKQKVSASSAKKIAQNGRKF